MFLLLLSENLKGVLLSINFHLFSNQIQRAFDALCTIKEKIIPIWNKSSNRPRPRLLRLLYHEKLSFYLFSTSLPCLFEMPTHTASTRNDILQISISTGFDCAEISFFYQINLVYCHNCYINSEYGKIWILLEPK